MERCVTCNKLLYFWQIRCYHEQYMDDELNLRRAFHIKCFKTTKSGKLLKHAGFSRFDDIIFEEHYKSKYGKCCDKPSYFENN